jgi:hypothetical protein
MISSAYGAVSDWLVLEISLRPLDVLKFCSQTREASEKPRDTHHETRSGITAALQLTGFTISFSFGSKDALSNNLPKVFLSGTESLMDVMLG